MKNIQLIIIFFYIIIGASLLYYMSYYTTYLHELVHKKIFELFGCKANIVINCGIYGCSGYTQPVNCTLSKDDFMKMMSLQLYNEIINYNLYTPLLYIMSIIYITGLYFMLFSFSKD